MLQVLRHEDTDTIPMAIDFDAHAMRKYRDILAGKGPAEFFDLWHRCVHVAEQKARRDVDYGVYYEHLPPEARMDVWGTAKVNNEYESIRHFYPMQGFSDPSQIDEYPFPDFSRPACTEGLREKVDRLKNEGLLVLGITARVVFPICWHLRGMQEFLMDLILNPQFAERLLDRATECQLEIVRGLARAGVDVLWLGIDVATQQATMISPEMWAEWIKPRMKMLFDEARRIQPDILLAIHCCGAATGILDHLVDIGLNILNPVQPESMDLEYVKNTYGDALTFWGGVSIQRALPRGTAQQVRDEVRDRMRVLGRNGGYVVCPAHALTSDVPWENVLAFVEGAARK